MSKVLLEMDLVTNLVTIHLEMPLRVVRYLGVGLILARLVSGPGI